MDVLELINRLRMSTTILPPATVCHAAADALEHLERRVVEYEETIRYLTLQLGKTL